MKLSSSDYETLEKVKDLLQKEYKYHYTQAQLARRFHINESKLRKGFVLVYKKPIYDFLIYIRIERAKELLTGPDEPIKIIAYKVGYNVKSLEKQFKKLTGMSPLDWRKKNPMLVPFNRRNGDGLIQ